MKKKHTKFPSAPQEAAPITGTLIEARHQPVRRAALSKLIAAGGVVGASQWVTPVVSTVMLPAHAQTTSPVGNGDGDGNGNGNGDCADGFESEVVQLLAIVDVPNLDIEIAITLSTPSTVDVEVTVGGETAISANLSIDLTELLDGGLLSFQVILPCVGGGFVALTVTNANVAITGALVPTDLAISITGTVNVDVQCTDFIDCSAELNLALSGDLVGEVTLVPLAVSLSAELTGDLGDTSLTCCVALLPQD